MGRVHSLNNLKHRDKRPSIPKKSGVHSLADLRKNKSGKVSAKTKKDDDGDYETSDEEEIENELNDDGIEEVDEELGEGQWEELDEHGKVIVVEAPDTVPPTTEEVADNMKSDERFAALTRRHRISFGNVIAKHDFIAKNTTAADRELDFNDTKSGGAKGDRRECLFGTHYVKRTKGRNGVQRERWVLLPEAERSRLDEDLKAKGIKCACAVCIEREKNSFAIQKNIAGETRSGKKTGADAKWREMGEGRVLGTN